MDAGFTGAKVVERDKEKLTSSSSSDARVHHPQKTLKDNNLFWLVPRVLTRTTYRGPEELRKSPKSDHTEDQKNYETQFVDIFFYK